MKQSKQKVAHEGDKNRGIIRQVVSRTALNPAFEILKGEPQTAYPQCQTYEDGYTNDTMHQSEDQTPPTALFPVMCTHPKHHLFLIGKKR